MYIPGRVFPMMEDEPGGSNGGDPDPEPDPTPDPPEPDKDPAPDPEKEAQKWKALARKHEQQAKANADAAEKLKELENAGKSETEKLQAALDEYKSKAREATVKSLKLQVAAEKGLHSSLAKFLPDVDNEVDMMQAADELLEASGSAGKAEQPTRPKSNLTNPLRDDDDPASSRDALISAMLGKPTN